MASNGACFWRPRSAGCRLDGMLLSFFLVGKLQVWLLLLISWCFSSSQSPLQFLISYWSRFS